MRRSAVLAGLAALIASVSSTPVTSAAVARATHFAGHTSQRAGHYGVQTMPDNIVTFTVSGGRVVDFVIPWVSPCIDSYRGKPDAPLIDRSGFDPLPLHNGRFRIDGGGYVSSPGPHQRANVELVLSGAIHGRQASGTLSVTAAINVDDAYTSDFCSTRTPIRWRASVTR